MARLLLLLLLFVVSPLAFAQHWDVYASGGTCTDLSGGSYSYEYFDASTLTGDQNNAEAESFEVTYDDPVVQAQGEVTFTFNWNPDGTSAPPPQNVVIWEQSTASAATYDPTGLGNSSADDGFGDPATYYLNDTDWESSIVSWRNNFVVKNNPGQSFSLSWSPKAVLDPAHVGNDICGASVDALVHIWSPTLTVQGPNPTTGAVIIGQACKATISGMPAQFGWETPYVTWNFPTEEDSTLQVGMPIWSYTIYQDPSSPTNSSGTINPVSDFTSNVTGGSCTTPTFYYTAQVASGGCTMTATLNIQTEDGSQSFQVPITSQGFTVIEPNFVALPTSQIGKVQYWDATNATPGGYNPGVVLKLHGAVVPSGISSGLGSSPVPSFSASASPRAAPMDTPASLPSVGIWAGAIIVDPPGYGQPITGTIGTFAWFQTFNDSSTVLPAGQSTPLYVFQPSVTYLDASEPYPNFTIGTGVDQNGNPVNQSHLPGYWWPANNAPIIPHPRNYADGPNFQNLLPAMYDQYTLNQTFHLALMYTPLESSVGSSIPVAVRTISWTAQGQVPTIPGQWTPATSTPVTYDTGSALLTGWFDSTLGWLQCPTWTMRSPVNTN